MARDLWQLKSMQAAFCRDFNKLLEDVPADRQGEVRELFCDVMGRYLKITEGKDGTSENGTGG